MTAVISRLAAKTRSIDLVHPSGELLDKKKQGINPAPKKFCVV
tara:strand:- start:521 stop:649 length:129 start_codon:yes stop_codon:yes gene_type:complete